MKVRTITGEDVMINLDDLIQFLDDWYEKEKKSDSRLTLHYLINSLSNIREKAKKAS